MKRYFVLAGLAAFLCGNVAFAQNASQEGYKRLATASFFSVGGVGRGGGISTAEQELWRLVQTRDEKTLVALTKEKNTAAQMYALVGLRYLGNAQYKTAANSLAKSQGKVKTIMGCIAGEEPVAKIATQISSGFYNESLKYDMEHRQK